MVHDSNERLLPYISDVMVHDQKSSAFALDCCMTTGGDLSCPKWHAVYLRIKHGSRDRLCTYFV